ncbi:MAG: Crp/Fnr family transcriptional regulator [Ferruginibacter sp.]
MNFDLLLSSIAKHISLNKEEIEFFISLFRPASLTKGEFLLREGEVCKYETFIVKGSLKIYFQDENVTEHIIDFTIEEWWASDPYSLLTQTPSTSNIKALENTEVLRISKTDLEILYQRVPKFERFFRVLFQNAYITQREQINSNVSIDAAERYRLFLQKKPYAEKRFSQKDIASYIGITPQFLSVLKKKMRLVNLH